MKIEIYGAFFKITTTIILFLAGWKIFDIVNYLLKQYGINI